MKRRAAAGALNARQALLPSAARTRPQLPPMPSAQPLMGHTVAQAVASHHGRPLSDEQSAGIVVPADLAHTAIVLGRAAAPAFYRQEPEAAARSDGDRSVRPAIDFVPRQLPWRPRPFTEREVKTILNNVSTAAQQAVLNGAIAIHADRNPSDPRARLAARVASRVGRLWETLPSRASAATSFNTGAAEAGVIHLYVDVVQSMLDHLREWCAQARDRNPELFLELMEQIGGAGEIGRQAALGSTQSTLHFNDEVMQRVPIYGCIGMLPANLIYRTDAMNGAVDVRDKLINTEAVKIARETGIKVTPEEVQSAMAQGCEQASSAASQVQEAAAAFGPTLLAKVLAAADKAVV